LGENSGRGKAQGALQAIEDLAHPIEQTVHLGPLPAQRPIAIRQRLKAGEPLGGDGPAPQSAVLEEGDAPAAVEATLAGADTVGLAATDGLLAHDPGEGGEVGNERVDEAPEASDELAQLATPEGALLFLPHSVYIIYINIQMSRGKKENLERGENEAELLGACRGTDDPPGGSWEAVGRRGWRFPRCDIREAPSGRPGASSVTYPQCLFR